MYIYKTTNRINNKVYIGKSMKTFNENYLGSGVLLNRALKKYGRENFSVEVIEHAEDINELNEKEKYWIAKYKDNSYNIAEGGTGGNTLGNHPNKKQHYKKVAKKISKTLKGHLVSEVTRKKLSKSHKEWFQNLSEDEKLNFSEKISKRMKEIYKDGHHSKGKKLTEEHKKKLSAAAIKNKFGGNIFSTFSSEKQKEIKEKMSKSRIGRVLSNETKEKISQSLLGHTLTKETRQKISNTLKNKKHE
jgi:group I intron endonuclease